MKNQFLYDCEFLERGPGHPISLISIGVVHPASGKTYYAVLRDMPVAAIKESAWLMENVWPYLPTLDRHPSGGVCRCRDQRHLDISHPDVKPRETVAAELAMFISTLGSPLREDNELWAWFSSYDHVVLCQLFGTMNDLPACIPMFTRDLRDAFERAGCPPLPEQKVKLHDARADAQWNVEVAKFLGVI